MNRQEAGLVTRHSLLVTWRTVYYRIKNKQNIQIFHKVKQRPGKPFLFGMTKEGKFIYGLPGNPVSTQVCFYRYILPHLYRCMGLDSIQEEFIALDEDVEIKIDLTYFLPIKIKHDKKRRLTAKPIFPNNSGDYVALAQSDGFVELEAEKHHFPK